MGAEADWWFYKGPDGKRGPVSKNELLQRLVEGAIPADAPVWRDGLETWTPAGELTELRVAGFVYPPAAHRTRPGGPNRLIALFTVLIVTVCIAGTIVSKPRRQSAIQPNSTREKLIAIGRSADLGSMPSVIDAVANSDAEVASTAIIVAERLLGVRYSHADRKDPVALAGKITADWKATQDQMRRRLGGRDTSAQ